MPTGSTKSGSFCAYTLLRVAAVQNLNLNSYFYTNERFSLVGCKIEGYGRSLAMVLEERGTKQNLLRM